MNYEQKYKEALERMKSWVRGEHPECFCEAQKAAEFIFPELAESNDDRIKREILELVSIAGNGNQFEEIKDWLEKQGEFDDNIITRNDEILQAISVGLTDVAKDAGWSDFGGIPIEEIQDWLEKCEQKLLDADKVIDWLDRNAAMFWESPCNPSRIVELFKEDFEL